MAKGDKGKGKDKVEETSALETKLVQQAKAEETPTAIGEPVDLEAWLVETEERDVDGAKVEARKNLTDAQYEALKDGKRITDKDGKVLAIQSADWNLTIELSKRRIPTANGTLYGLEYGNLTPRTIDAALALVNNVTDETYTTDEKTKKEEEVDSIVKFFRQAWGMKSRNDASMRIASLVEGPEKALEQAIKAIMKARGFSREKATERAKAAMED